MINKKELERLSPEDRVQKLKQLEEEKKKEVIEIEELIRKSMQELKTGKLAEEITPEQRPVDIARLFATSGEEQLERTARQGMPAVALMKGTKVYQALVQTYETYNHIKKLGQAFSMYGNLTQEEKDFLTGKAGERINFAARYLPEAENIANLLNATRAALYKLKKETGLD